MPLYQPSCMICKVDACDQRVTARGLCRKHYREARIRGDIVVMSKYGGCRVQSCTKQHYAKGMCDEHYTQCKKHGDPKVRKRYHNGENPNPRANGYKFVRVDDNLVPEHRHVMSSHLGRGLRQDEVVLHLNGRRDDNRLENLRVHVVGTGGYVSHNGYRIIHCGGYDIAEHRYVMEQILGRPLRQGENVHHCNGDRLDNRPENLELWNRHQPSGQRVTDKIRWAQNILREYASDLAALSLNECVGGGR